MFERFSDEARHCVVRAQEEARGLRHNYIGTEHLLLGIMRENEGMAMRILLEEGVDAAAIQTAVLALLPGRGALRPPAGSARAHRSSVDAAWLDGIAVVLEQLAADIRSELDRDPDSGDLLLALACAPRTLPGQALTAIGVDLDRLWATIEELRARAAGAQAENARQIEEASRAKMEAIEAREFERAAELRDRERELREMQRRETAAEVAEALDAIRRRLGIPRTGDDPGRSEAGA